MSTKIINDYPAFSRVVKSKNPELSDKDIFDLYNSKKLLLVLVDGKLGLARGPRK